ncbi:YqaJ viral recombinase family protein [Corynebacterium sp. USCH3]|uniref:lambda-exonuclease family protein n=1 Tax=Corynebacterium sp. USCH3 TaxID=3024840 RepID=UPI0030AD7B61
MHSESYQQQPSGHILPGSDEHRRLMTGSKIAAALGLSKFETPAELWHRMRGDVPPQESTPAMRRGHNQEAAILEWYFTEMRPDLEQTSAEQTFTRPDLPWAAANPDAVAVEDREVVFIDAKSIARDGGEWGKTGTDQVPLYYVTQMMWAMHMTHGPEGFGVTRTYVVKHGPYVDQYDEYYVDYDPALADQIRQRVHAFWDSLTDDQGCPPITDRAGTHRVFAKLHPDIVPDSVWEISPAVARDYIHARDQTKAAQAAEDAAKARILTAMGTAKTAVCGGVKVGYRRPTKNGVSFYPPQRPVDVSDLPDEQEDAA